MAEQLRRLAGIHRRVEVEAVPGAPDGLGWRTRVRFAVDRSGRIGLHRHRSHDIEPVEHCPIATAEVDRGRGGLPAVEGRPPCRGHRLAPRRQAGGGGGDGPASTGRAAHRLDAGLVVDGRTVRSPDRSRFDVLGHRFEVSTGVFWQVHPSAATLLTEVVLEGLAPQTGETVADLYAGAGLFIGGAGDRPLGPEGGWWRWSGVAGPAPMRHATPSD